MLIVVLNAVLGFYQERRAEAALDALEKMQTPNARVRRDDVVAIDRRRGARRGRRARARGGRRRARRRAPSADDRTSPSRRARSPARACPRRRTRAPASPTTPRSATARRCSSSARASCAARGAPWSSRHGARTELGKLSRAHPPPRDRTTPLEEKLDAFGKRILWACLALSGSSSCAGTIKGDRSWHELLLEAVSLAVAAIPEGLPAITTITLALGMQRMAKRGAIIRKLAAVETLGAATVICTDKTGTLTQNEMTVREVYAGGERFHVTGTGYDPSGDIVDTINQRRSPPPRTAPRSAGHRRPLQQRHAPEARGQWRVQGDPTEGALLTLAAKGACRARRWSAPTRSSRSSRSTATASA
jgi:P-type Ca2+ transporter type 2C